MKNKTQAANKIKNKTKNQINRYINKSKKLKK